MRSARLATRNAWSSSVASPGRGRISHVASIRATIAALNDIAISQRPVSSGQSEQISVFIRDPDRNVIELRGREQDMVEAVTRYVP